MNLQHYANTVWSRLKQHWKMLSFSFCISALSVVNRAYYAMFYAVLALLQDTSPLPSKHTGIIGLFDVMYIRTSIFDKQRSKDLHRAFDLRQASDYKTIAPITNEQAEEITASARVLLETVVQFLAKQ